MIRRRQRRAPAGHFITKVETRRNPHRCVLPPWTDRRGHELLASGTVWQCDECGEKWTRAIGGGWLGEVHGEGPQ